MQIDCVYELLKTKGFSVLFVLQGSSLTPYLQQMISLEENQVFPKCPQPSSET